MSQLTSMKQALEALEGYEGRRAKAILRQAIEQSEKSQAMTSSFPERDESKPADQQGLFRKFIVNRVDGSDRPSGKHFGCDYFVLDMDHDKHAPAALRAYAESCKHTHPELSKSLINRFGEPTAPAQSVAIAWAEGYRAGIEDERTSEANIGIAGFGMKVEPARENPYRTPTAPAQQAVPSIEQAEKQEPVAYECPKGCGCWWRDNKDSTMSLFNGEHKSCSVCENLSLSDLRPVSLADHLFIEHRDGDNWLVCVEGVFKGEAEAKKACQKWKGYTHPPTAQGLFVDMISRHEGLAEELAAAPPQQPLTDEQIADWALRHDVNGSVTDLRCTAEDVRSIKGASL